MRERDKYLKIVEWSEEDQCYVGSVPGWIGRCCHGNDETKVYKELCQIVDEWIEIYKKDGIKLPQTTVERVYSGKFVLRTGKELHEVLAIKALNAGDSLNTYCVKKLRKTILG
ncbi:MAG: toxin-antitoxin system HicB family antitoxin [Candidatus Marinimicrobia bacterium]|nr:toxin-antitoxin system HicB family antitoxin [bacterium]MCG2716835.1 toxin-antitoxin system HicB family antitoxin [Candidatus Neomarinimicrobiota bacterium]